MLGQECTATFLLRFLSGNWRMVFRFEGEEVVDVDVIDYHEEAAMTMKEPAHPGEVIRELCLEPLGLTVTKAAEVLGVTRKALSELLNGHAGISPEMAVRLSKAFGGSVESWLRQQMIYDLAQVTKRAAQIQVQRYEPA
jgi:antitoxin HigA-1